MPETAEPPEQAVSQLRSNMPVKVYTSQDLARLVRESRKEAGLSQDELAQKLGVSQSLISHAENLAWGRLRVEARIRVLRLLANREFEGPYVRVPHHFEHALPLEDAEQAVRFWVDRSEVSAL